VRQEDEPNHASSSGSQPPNLGDDVAAMARLLTTGRGFGGKGVGDTNEESIELQSNACDCDGDESWSTVESGISSAAHGCGGSSGCSTAPSCAGTKLSLLPFGSLLLDDTRG
jgi:hypothetical protein